MRRLATALLLAPLLLAGACHRTHMGARYGVPVRAALQRQVIDPNAGNAPPTAAQGLDPQEAAIVLDRYRRSLSPATGDDAARRAPVMVLQPTPPPATPSVTP
jgi:hypothetical protein